MGAGNQKSHSDHFRGVAEPQVATRLDAARAAFSRADCDYDNVARKAEWGGATRRECEIAAEVRSDALEAMLAAAREEGVAQMKERAKAALRRQRDQDPRDIGTPYASALSVAVDIVDRLPVKPEDV